MEPRDIEQTIETKTDIILENLLEVHFENALYEQMKISWKHVKI